ncbi:hypothetical protein F5880DRAFT_1502502 [Lentinula raphanica]|nr:hypothetical protein F5880DRAFT_1502502 [Lentinula raphanica]
MALNLFHTIYTLFAYLYTLIFPSKLYVSPFSVDLECGPDFREQAQNVSFVLVSPPQRSALRSSPPNPNPSASVSGDLSGIRAGPPLGTHESNGPKEEQLAMSQCSSSPIIEPPQTQTPLPRLQQFVFPAYPSFCSNSSSHSIRSVAASPIKTLTDRPGSSHSDSLSNSDVCSQISSACSSMGSCSTPVSKKKTHKKQSPIVWVKSDMAKLGLSSSNMQTIDDPVSIVRKVFVECGSEVDSEGGGARARLMNRQTARSFGGMEIVDEEGEDKEDYISLGLQTLPQESSPASCYTPSSPPTPASCYSPVTPEPSAPCTFKETRAEPVVVTCKPPTQLPYLHATLSGLGITLGHSNDSLSDELQSHPSKTRFSTLHPDHRVSVVTWSDLVSFSSYGINMMDDNAQEGNEQIQGNYVAYSAQDGIPEELEDNADLANNSLEDSGAELAAVLDSMRWSQILFVAASQCNQTNGKNTRGKRTRNEANQKFHDGDFTITGILYAFSTWWGKFGNSPISQSRSSFALTTNIPKMYIPRWMTLIVILAIMADVTRGLPYRNSNSHLPIKLTHWVRQRTKCQKVQLPVNELLVPSRQFSAAHKIGRLGVNNRPLRSLNPVTVLGRLPLGTRGERSDTALPREPEKFE